MCVQNPDLNRRLLTLFLVHKKVRTQESILLLNMGDKIYILIIHVDLSCCHCRKQIEKCLCRMQRREGISDIVFDDKNNVVVINGPFCNPHKLKERLMCKLPKVITSIEIKDPAQGEKEKCEKELEKCRKEKEKFEKELEKCRSEGEKWKSDKEKCEKDLEKCKCERENCEKELKKCKCEKEKYKCEKEKCKCEKEKCETEKGPPICISVRPWPPASTECNCKPASPCRPTVPCRPGPSGLCSCDRPTGWNEHRCRCSSCGPAPSQPCNNQGWDSNCKTIILEEYPSDSCSIM